MTKKNWITTLVGFGVALGMGVADVSVYESGKASFETYTFGFSSFMYASKTQSLENTVCRDLNCDISGLSLENSGIIATEGDGYVTKASLEFQGTDSNSKEFTAQLQLGSDNGYTLLKDYQKNDGSNISLEKAMECVSLWSFSASDPSETLLFSLSTEVATNPKASGSVSYLLKDSTLQKVSADMVGKYNVIDVDSSLGSISAIYFQ